MKVTGTASLAAPVAAVRAVLTEPEALVEVLPHVDAFTWLERGDGSFTATMRPAIALGEIPFRTAWRPVAAPEGTVAFHVDGRTDEHALGLDVEVRLDDAPGGGTVAAWEVTIHVTGTLRSAGQRVLGPIVAQQARLVLAAADAAALAATRP